MDSRSAIPKTFFGRKFCVYCAGLADTNDHAPPRCLLRKPLPANLITLPACRKCNSGFSFDENVVRSILTLVSTHPTLIEEQQPGGRLRRALDRDPKLRALVDRSRQGDGNYALTPEVRSSFEGVFQKTVQGLYYGLYERLVPAQDVQLLRIENHRLISPNDLIIELRPSPLRDITDKPLSPISPSSWHMREPIFIIEMQPISGAEPEKRIFRLTRETPVEWVLLQPGIFSYAFVQRDGGGAACVLSLWETLVIAVSVPWPDGRGPLRRGRKNPMSRDS